MADKANNVVYFRSGDGTPFYVPEAEAEATYNQGYNPIEDDADIEVAKQQIRLGEEPRQPLLQDIVGAEKKSTGETVEALAPYDPAMRDRFVGEGKKPEEAVRQAQKEYKFVNEALKFNDKRTASGYPQTVAGEFATTFLENYLGMQTFGATNFLEDVTGETYQNQARREEENPVAATAGKALGLIGPAGVGLAIKGLGKVLGKLGLETVPKILSGAGTAIGKTDLVANTIANAGAKAALTQAEKNVIKATVEGAVRTGKVVEKGAFQKTAKVLESELAQKTIEQKLKTQGYSDRVITLLRMGLGAAPIAGLAGAVSGLTDEAKRVSMDASAEYEGAVNTGEFIGGTLANAGFKAAESAAISALLPPTIDTAAMGIKGAMAATNKALRFLARETPVVGVPTLGSLAGDATKQEILDVMRQAEVASEAARGGSGAARGGAKTITSSTKKLAEALDNEYQAFARSADANEPMNLIGDLYELKRQELLLRGLTDADAARGAQQMADSFRRRTTQAAINLRTKFMKNVGTARRERFVFDPDKLAAHYASTTTNDLPAEFEAFRSLHENLADTIDAVRNTAAAGGAVALDATKMPARLLRNAYVMEQALSSPTGRLGEVVPPIPLPFDFATPEAAIIGFQEGRAAEVGRKGIEAGALESKFGPLGQIAGVLGGGAGIGALTNNPLLAAAAMPLTYGGAAVLNPAGVIKTINTVDNTAIRMSAAIDGFATAIFSKQRATPTKITLFHDRPTIGGRDPMSLKNDETVYGQNKAALENVNPEAIADYLAGKNAGLDEFNKNLADVSGRTTILALGYLKNNLPKEGPQGKPSPQDLSSYGRKNRYILRPDLVMADAQEKNFVAPEGIDVLRSVYPATLLEIQSSLTEEYAKALAAKQVIDPTKMKIYKTFMGMDRATPVEQQQIELNRRAIEGEKATVVPKFTKKAQEGRQSLGQ